MKAISIIGAVLCAALFAFHSPFSGIPARLKQKLDSAVQTTFELGDFKLTRVQVTADIEDKTPVTISGENLFRVESGSQLKGYAYLGEAPSMKNVFDYVVLLNPDLSIRKSKVLIYREDYGRQIGSQRWLKQFIGSKSGESLEYGTDIDAISGATISAKSMTTAVNRVLASLEVLKAESIL